MAEALKTKKTRTSRSFQAQQPLLPIVKAGKRGRIHNQGRWKTDILRKGYGMMTAPIVETLEENTGEVKFEVFLRSICFLCYHPYSWPPKKCSLNQGMDRYTWKENSGATRSTPC
jgi:hypothetical protein